MIVLIDSSTSIFRLTIVKDKQKHSYEWQADRQLAKGILGYLRDRLAERSATLQDVKGLGVFQGPGSFTGLRIGITVANTLAESLSVPIVGVCGDAWQDDALRRLSHDENDRIVLPEYGGDARITKPRK